MPDLTLADLDELERLDKAATPGPWAWVAERGSCMPSISTPDTLVCNFGFSEVYYPIEGTPFSDENADFLIALRNAAPALISLARAGIAGAEEMRERAEQLAEVCDHDTLLDALATLKAHQGD